MTHTTAPPTWTTEEAAAIRRQFLDRPDRMPTCPLDGATLVCVMAQQCIPLGRHVSARCPACGRRKTIYDL